MTIGVDFVYGTRLYIPQPWNFIMSDPLSKLDEIEFDASDLWREEVVTDRKTGSIRIMHPVTPAGEPDVSRATEYFAQTQIMTQAGALPLEGPIEAENLEEAIGKFAPAAKEAMREMMDRMREYQREAANQIVTPDQAMGGGGGAGPGGLGGGGGAGGAGGFSLK